MHRNSETEADVLAQIQKSLDAGRPNDAIDLIRRHGAGSAELRNAYGVCLMRIGDVPKAIEVYRDLVLQTGSVCLKEDAPTLVKTNFATALLLDNNVAGCLTLLDEIHDEQNGGIIRLRAAISRWKRSLPWWRRLWLKLGGGISHHPVPLDFPPGELGDTRKLRPAA